MKKLTAALCAVLLVLCVCLPGASAAGPALSATRAYCIVDADTGLVLAQQNMNEELHPASITKVMTLGLACEKAQGNWDGVKLTVTHEDVYSLAGTDSSHIALREGEEVPLVDAFMPPRWPAPTTARTCWRNISAAAPSKAAWQR